MARTVLIKKIRLPAAGNINEDINFICKSFGYFSLRDKQDSAGRIFRLLVKQGCGHSTGISSDDLAKELDLSRGAIVHHLNNFIKSGLVVKECNLYRIRSESIQKSIEEIKEDIDRIFKQMSKIAKEIDEKLGNYYR
ncbi:MAG: winged helix-turn-helix domain-containing protein [Thermoplasmatota archaeon]